MKYAAVLYFDPVSFDTITEYWQKIDSLYMKLGVTPHISLAVFDAVDIPLMGTIIKEFASQQNKIPVSMPSVGLFLTVEKVIYLAPVMTRPLMELHTRFYERLTGRNLPFDPLYRPGNWVPHCTLDMELTAEEYSKKMALCGGFAPIEKAELISIGLIEFRPVKEVFRHGLKG